MSWDDHLNALKGHGLTHAAICDNKAASWVTVSDGCNVSFLERISLAILAHSPHFWQTRVWRSLLKVDHFVTCFRACKSDEQSGRERRGHAAMLRCPEQANPEKQQRNKKCRETDAGGRVDDRRRCGRTRADRVMQAARLLANAPRPSLSASDGSSSRARRVACMETAPHPLAPNEYEIVIGFMSALSKLQML